MNESERLRVWLWGFFLLFYYLTEHRFFCLMLSAYCFLFCSKSCFWQMCSSEVEFISWLLWINSLNGSFWLWILYVQGLGLVFDLPVELREFLFWRLKLRESISGMMLEFEREVNLDSRDGGETEFIIKVLLAWLNDNTVDYWIIL